MTHYYQGHQGHQQNVYQTSAQNHFPGAQYSAASGPPLQTNYIPQQQNVMYSQQQMNYAQQQQLYYQQQNPAPVTQPQQVQSRGSQQAGPRTQPPQMYSPHSSQPQQFTQLQDSTNVQNNNNSSKPEEVFKKPAVPHSKPRSETKENVSVSLWHWFTDIIGTDIAVLSTYTYVWYKNYRALMMIF